jgi:hypothetical protein
VFDSRLRQRTFSLTSVSRPALRPTQPPIQLVSGSCPGGKPRSGRDADHSHPSSAEVKNEQELYGVAGQLYFYYTHTEVSFCLSASCFHNFQQYSKTPERTDPIARKFCKLGSLQFNIKEYHN